MLDRRPTRLAVALLAGCAGAVWVASPAAAAPCEGYSAVCPETPGNPPKTGTPVQIQGNSPGLAATGGEVALLSLVGFGAVGGGAALVVAGRRRRATA